MYAPQLATLVTVPPSGAGWCHEIKYDGYRIGCRIEGTRVTLTTRNGNDWTAAYPDIVRAALALGVRDALIDGEVVVLLADGRTSFQLLQHASGGEPSGGTLTYFAFDLLRLDGEIVERLPLLERKSLLKTLIGHRSRGRIRFSEHSEGSGSGLLADACRRGFEGIVSKRADKPYQHGRSRDWLKAKCIRRQEFVIGGFTDPEGIRAGLGALLVGYYDGARLVFAGKVGTGFTQAFAADLRKRLDGLEQSRVPFEPSPPRTIARRAHWVRPSLVCEVSFTEWTGDGMVRHPVFQGLRSDKKPREVRREREEASSVQDASIVTPTSTSRGVAVRDRARPAAADSEASALDLARYYESVAGQLAPHVEGRPLTLFRLPKRGSGTRRAMTPPARVAAPLRLVRTPWPPRNGHHIVIHDVVGITRMIEMGVVEIRASNVTIRDLERPNRLLIDLNPGDGVSWPRLVDAARHVRHLFGALDLEAFCKTTGGRGLQVVVPLVPHADWRACLAFARALSHAMARTDRDALTTSPNGNGRERRILVDYRGNDRGAASIAAFSVCARTPGAVSVPIAWNDLEPSRPPDAFTIVRVPIVYAPGTKDPWAGYWKNRQKLTKERVLALDRHRL